MRTILSALEVFISIGFSHTLHSPFHSVFAKAHHFPEVIFMVSAHAADLSFQPITQLPREPGIPNAERKGLWGEADVAVEGLGLTPIFTAR